MILWRQNQVVCMNYLRQFEIAIILSSRILKAKETYMVRCFPMQRGSLKNFVVYYLNKTWKDKHNIEYFCALDEVEYLDPNLNDQELLNV